MMYRRGGKPGGGTDKLHFIECSTCGCPNRPHEQKCMYCQTELQGPAAAIRGHLYPYLNNIRAFFSFQQPADESKGLLRSGLALLLASVLIGVGVSFVVRGAHGGGYFNWMVGALLFIYGGAALHGAWAAFFRK